MEKMVKFVKRVVNTLITRPIRNYNVEERAFKAIEKKVVAPKHLTTQEKILKYIEEHPEVKDVVVEKPKTLLEWLKKIRVVSYDAPQIQASQSDRKLPMKRDTYPMPHMFGELEPKVVPKGKITFSRTTELVTDYASQRGQLPPHVIAEKYGLNEEDAKNLVKHFRPFELFLPASKSGDYSKASPWLKQAHGIPFLEPFADFDKDPEAESKSKELAVKEEKETK